MFRKFESQMYCCNRVMAHVPSHRLRLAFYRNVMKFQIGPDSFIFMDAWFDAPGNFTMGHNSIVNQKCRLDNRGGLTIGNTVSISAETCILTADHDPNSSSFSGRTAPVVFEDYTFVGTRAMIMPGVTIHRGAIVAAGALVTKDVPELTIVAGVPARPIGERSADLDYSINYGVWFH